MEHPKIEHNGKMVHTTNSMDQPIHHTEEGIKNFHDWFGDSSNVDEHGRPNVMYHGTGGDFSKFQGDVHWASKTPYLASQYAEYRGDMEGKNAHVMPVYVRTKKTFDSTKLGNAPSVGTLFNELSKQTDKPISKELLQTVRDAAREEESGPHYSRHSFWHKPETFFGAKGKEAIQQAFHQGGFDSIKDDEHDGHETIGTFHPENIKSVIGNSGNFSSESPHIHESFVQYRKRVRGQ